MDFVKILVSAVILDTIAAPFLFLCRLESSSSDSSEEYVPEGDADEDEDGDEDVSPEAEEPLVRCKRPMCEMYCEFGFQTDSTGCPTCECLDAADSHLIGRPDGHEPPAAASTRPPCRGPEPMCANYCPGGYRYNEDGCMTCECVGAPAARTRPRCRGPMPMCANRCPGGYRYKPDGCMTCECAEEPQPDNCMVSESSFRFFCCVCVPYFILLLL